MTSDYSILKANVTLLFHSNSQAEHNQKVEAKEPLPTLTLSQIIQRVFEEHASGINFREWGAGSTLSWEMTYHGFNVTLQLDRSTGFIVGGNSHNCLTWMDKLGSSKEAGNLGVPATPRDGAPIELTGLVHLALKFVIGLNEQGHFEWKSAKGVEYSHWKTMIEQSFEREYWVEELGVLRDTVRGDKPEEQSYLRPNSLVALALSPELLSVEKTKRFIENVEKQLIVSHFLNQLNPFWFVFQQRPNSIGLKTLTPEARDLYVSYYDNDDQSTNFATAKGFSYHQVTPFENHHQKLLLFSFKQGPEWVWPYGYYIMVKKSLAKKEGKPLTQPAVLGLLANHQEALRLSTYSSLTELTNDDGNHNHFSCESQAWSVGAILEALTYSP